MKLYRFEQRQTVPISLEEAWEFFSNPGNLREITPESMGFQVTTELPDRMYAGLIVAYKVRPFPLVPLRWVTEITQVDEPNLLSTSSDSVPIGSGITSITSRRWRRAWRCTM
jgi:ligand-binding SRPBCC domain-containing protein